MIKEILVSLITRSNAFVYQWGYLGIFFMAFIESAFIVFPITTLPLIFTFGGILNPFLVALVAALGGTIGSSTSYILGAGGKELAEKKYWRQLQNLRERFEKRGFIFIVFVTFLPVLPDNLMALFLGMIRYDIRKFFLFFFIGKFAAQAIVAYSGYYSITWMLRLLEIELL
ncbi:hypothetical protein A3K63_01290 [Candidatus Micrarchaeota archaeon RBG_16_49_10]|nr:MAG: hypothetical protein A3K63_01290 [Candidatus Micrarchaeota archaeon RBG_16_49_10]